MKKYVVVAIALAIVTQACQKIEEFEGQSNLPENILTASINAETRTMLGESDGTKYAFWLEGDEIGVFIDGKSKTTYTLKDGAGTPKATFTGFGTGSNYVAVYPAVAAESINGNTISLNLPSEQIWAKSSFGPNSFPMVTVSNTANLTFRNLCSVFKIQLKGNATILSISFKPNDETIRVAGEAVADISNPEIPVLTMSQNALNEVTLKCPEGGVTLAGEDPVDFYMVLPAQAYTGGFALTIRSTGGTMIQRTTNDLDMHRSEIRAAKPFEFKVTEGIAASESLAGEGTLEVPFLVQDVSDLLLFRNAVNNAGNIRSTDTGKEVLAQTSYYQLSSDVDLSGIEEWIPIGTGSGNSFKGTFNGGGHSITGLHIDSESDYVGLFGYCYEATIKNLSVTGRVSGKSYVGIIVGSANGCTLDNCESYGSVKGVGPYNEYSRYTGGVAGYFALSTINGNIIKEFGTITGCSNYAEVDGEYSTGGVVGYLYYSTMSNCLNYGTIASDVNVTGGIVGSMFNSNVYNCGNNGKVTGWMQLGGIVGLSSASSNKIFNCYNTGEVTILNYTNVDIIGGIVGENRKGGALSNCVNAGMFSGNVSGSNLVSFGGIAGSNSGSISNCYTLSACGAKEVVGTNTDGTLASVFALSEHQMGKEESTGYGLYIDAEGKNYTILLDALNAWAADNSDTAVIYYGWDYRDVDICPTVTFRPAVKPGSGSNESFSHSFGVVHTVVNTTTSFVLPGITGSFMNATVDWGDETNEKYGWTSSHRYTSTGEYTVTVTADNATSFKLGNLSGVTKLILN